jgi:UDP-N-acetylglucosamine 4,6-dehydratase (inverting)
MLNGKKVFLSGGTGSFGKAFIKQCLNDYPNIEKLIIFSRDELKQHEMQQEFSNIAYPNLRYFIGDIRDKNRLNRAMEDVDIIIHAAALKHVSVAEYNPFEFIQTNVIGTQNLLDVALDHDVENFISLSTDKASSPTNLYGATKLCADKLVISANNIKGKRKTKFSIVRYGNVFGSRGSVVPLFLEQKKDNVITITDNSMTRFNISLQDGVKMVFWALANNFGGEILVPQIPSYKVTDMAAAIGPECKIEEIGIRPGEKLHEEMISISDSQNTLQFDKYFAILPAANNKIRDYFLDNFNAKSLPENFSYSSDSNNHFLSLDDLKVLVSSYLSDLD